MLSVESVVAGYGETTVLRDVSVTVGDGSVVALLGANGAGKTTLMRAASGEIPVRAGRVRLGERDITTEQPNGRAKLGLCHIPEGRAVFPGLSVRENLTLFGPGGAEDTVARAAEAFPILGQRLGQAAGTLSGGEQQMLALARAYVTEPRVVLLDEVSMGLAPKVVDEIFAFIGRLAANGTALLLVEQYVSRALELADSVYILGRGRITFSGTPAELDQDRVLAGYLGKSGGR